ncbi:hypothetical protein Hamer_G000499 [Homarus americanus]|uniref:Uncharacterized protein n=1 Tax=Homarus americanus TaxID=6706 RepID=A0A8J5NB31_HOMAM|nr:hypothetical protein Hamer_G000499 [Homarus americanus]
MAACIIPLHVLIDCDHSSGFCGTGKKLVADRVQSYKEACDLLASCDSELQTPKDVLDDSEKFVIRYIYCDAKNTNMGEVSGVAQKNTILLAPVSDSLHLHFKADKLSQFSAEAPKLLIPPLIRRTWMAFV